MMKTPEFSYKSLRNLGVFLAVGALIAGCAGNHVDPAGPDTGPVSTSQIDKTQLKNQAVSENTIPTTTSPNTEVKVQENSSQQPSMTSASPDQPGNTIISSTLNSPGAATSTTTVQEPTQTTFYFGINKSQLNTQDKAVIAQHARFLKANPTLVLEINGHTDSSGPRAYNEYLSKQRAEAVASLLIQDGVKRSQLVIKALADNKPLADTSDPGNNRRVDLQYDDMNMLSSK